ncbi:CARDB domain-containing protein [Chloroflexota bacterium]
MRVEKLIAFLLSVIVLSLLPLSGTAILASEAVPEPDLVITEIDWSPENPKIGDEVQFTITISNHGEDEAGSSKVACYLDDEYLDSVSIGSLAPGTSADVFIDWIAQPGSHLIRAVADSAQNVVETDETNNATTFAFSVFAPDLVISSITGLPDSLAVGAEVVFTITVNNEGSSNARASRVYFYIDDIARGYYDIPIMAPEATSNMTFKWVATSGQHIARAVADGLNHVRESDETNNETELAFTTTVPDLYIDTLTWSPANPSQGDNITISISVKNQGQGKSNASRLAYYLDEIYLDSVYLKPLAPGAATSTTFSWQVETGVHTVKAFADSVQTIAEDDEENNIKTVVLPSTAPDLIVQEISWYPTNPLVAHRVTFTVGVKNSGDGDATQSRLYFYIDEELHYYSIGDLAAGASANSTLAWVTLMGSHSIRAVADAENTVVESDEGNNARAATFVPATALPSDLSVQDISWSPASPVEGQQVTITVLLKNHGSGASSWSNIAYYIDDAYFTSGLIGPIDSGATATLDFPWEAQPGTHDIYVVVDSEQRLAEVNEDNNTRQTTISVLAPDIVIKDISWSPLSPLAGDAVTLTMTVSNQGNYRAEPSYVGYHIHGLPRGKHYIGELAVGGAITETFSWVAPEDYHNISLVADINGEISELEENNNEKLVALPAPDLVMEKVTWSASDIAEGKTGIFTAEIRNGGAGTSSATGVCFYLDDVLTGSVDIGGIEPGDSRKVMLIGTASEGAHDVAAVVDVDDSIVETDESNNRQAIAFSISPDVASSPEAEGAVPASPATDVGVVSAETVASLDSKSIQAEIGQDIVLSLKANNAETSATMTVEVSLQLTSGVSIISPGFEEMAESIYIASYELPPGQQQIDIKLNVLEEGIYDITGNLLYYVDGNKASSKSEAKSFVVSVVAPGGEESESSSLYLMSYRFLQQWWPAFAVVFVGSVAILILLRVRSRQNAGKAVAAES